jgi:hypothetical protein
MLVIIVYYGIKDKFIIKHTLDKCHACFLFIIYYHLYYEHGKSKYESNNKTIVN